MTSPADYIFFGEEIITMDETNLSAEAEINLLMISRAQLNQIYVYLQMTVYYTERLLPSKTVMFSSKIFINSTFGRRLGNLPLM